MKKVDPELLKQLEQADANRSGTVEVVLSVVNPDHLPLPSPSEIKSTVERLLADATKRTHEHPAHYRVFANMGTFAVEATPHFLRDLMSQDDVLFAVANRRKSMFTREA